jgi:DNA-binding transcriptional LysR family regulator
VNVRDFLDVRVICETGSLRKAAAVLGVSQPTLGNRVAHLERQLGALLFKRSRGQSQPTELALFIAGRASTMADEAARLAIEVRRLAAGKTGLVKIGLAPAPARVLFPDIVFRLARRHPSISIDILSAPTAQLAEQLVRRELDLLICPALEQATDTVVSELQLESDIVVVARPDHPLCSKAGVVLADLFDYPIALPTLERRYLEILQRDHGIDLEGRPGRVLCSDPGTLARIIMMSPLFVTAAPRPYFGPELAAGVLTVVKVPVPFGHSLYLHYNRDVLPLPAVVSVQDMIREAFAEVRAR